LPLIYRWVEAILIKRTLKLKIYMSKLKKIGLGVVGVFVLLIIIGVMAGDSKPEEASNQDSGTPSAKSYQQVFTFSGNGAKKSEPFTITGDRFKIAYECQGDPSATYCGAFVYKVGSNLPQAIMNSPQSVKDETVIYTSVAGKGEYYIDTNVMGNFKMTVYDYK
jgi:hypothetical protein